MRRPAELHFRSMQPEDLEPCVDLYRLVYRNPPWRENWRHSVAKHRLEEIFGAPSCFCFGAWEGEELMAFCLGRTITRHDRLSAQIEELGVDPELNEALAGPQLLEYVLSQLAESGVSSIYATLPGDSPAFEWMQKAGFHLSRHYVLMVNRMEKR
jgi:hypothetical protein